MVKKALSVLLIICLSVCICSCSGNSGPEEAGEGQFIDAAGRVVDLPEDPSTATAASVYAVATPFFVALHITDRVKAFNVKKTFWKQNDGGLSKAGTVGNGTVDLEKLAAYSPTVLVHRSNDPDTVKAVTDLGVDVICITVENMDDVKSTLRMLGGYFGAQKDAEEACAWIDSRFDFIDSIVDEIPADERVTALMMGGRLGRIAGNDMLQTWMIEKAGGIPVADTGRDHNWIDAGIEAVMGYDPEYIFCTSSTVRDYDTEELLEGAGWSAMKAVTGSNIYVMPCMQDSWDMPGLSAVLGTMYMLHCMYPDYFSEEQLFAEMDGYYEFMFGKTFSPAELGYYISEDE